MDTTEKDRGIVKPNDVVLIFRPLVKDEEWTGRFQILLSAFGPPTIDMKVMEDLMSIAMLAAISVSFFEQNQDFADAIAKHSGENFKEDLSFESDLILTKDTKTYGGLH